MGRGMDLVPAGAQAEEAVAAQIVRRGPEDDGRPHRARRGSLPDEWTFLLRGGAQRHTRTGLARGGENPAGEHLLLREDEVAERPTVARRGEVVGHELEGNPASTVGLGGGEVPLRPDAGKGETTVLPGPGE